jgi:hypothetical protein
MVNLVAFQPGTPEEKLKRIDQAAEVLAPNLDPAVHDQDPIAAEESAYSMGHLMFFKRDWSRAEAYLVAATRQYPKNPEALHSRFLLCLCYTNMTHVESVAANDNNLPPDDRDKAQRRSMEFLEKCRAVAEPLQDELIKLEQDQKMTETEHQLLWDTSCQVVDSYFFQGRIDDAARLYNLLRIRCTKPTDELKVISQLWHCYFLLKDADKCANQVADLRTLLKSLPADAFDNSVAEKRRDYWENWLRQVEAIMAKARPNSMPQGQTVAGPKG